MLFLVTSTEEGGTSPNALQPSMHKSPQMDRHPFQLASDLALETEKLWSFPK